MIIQSAMVLVLLPVLGLAPAGPDRAQPSAAVTLQQDTQVLRDKNGKHLGTIKKVSDGKYELRDASGKHLGTYYLKEDITRDAQGRKVGTGNLLTSLLSR